MNKTKSSRERQWSNETSGVWCINTEIIIYIVEEVELLLLLLS